MTAAEFQAFYPQFAGVFPEPVLNAFVESAALRFSDFEEDAEDARRLYVAHRLTLYARTVPASSGSSGQEAASYAALATSGDGMRIASKRVDDVAITYASGSSSSSSGASALRDLEETTYGLQLLSLLRLHSYPRYVP